MERTFIPGEHVVYFDEYRRRHNALITVWHSAGHTLLSQWREKYGESTFPCVNLVFVLDDPKMTDPYGQQTHHESSVSHGSQQNPPNLGRHWLWPDEVTE